MENVGCKQAIMMVSIIVLVLQQRRLTVGAQGPGAAPSLAVGPVASSPALSPTLRGGGGAPVSSRGPSPAGQPRVSSGPVQAPLATSAGASPSSPPVGSPNAVRNPVSVTPTAATQAISPPAPPSTFQPVSGPASPIGTAVAETSKKSSGLSGGAKAGVAVVVIGAALSAAGGIFIYKKRQENLQRASYGGRGFEL